MSGRAAATVVVSLLLFAEPPLDGVAGYLLIQDGHRNIGGILLLVKALLVIAVPISPSDDWLRPPCHALAALVVSFNMNAWLGLFALVYSVAMLDWIPAFLLLAGLVLPEIGGKMVGVGLFAKKGQAKRIPR